MNENETMRGAESASPPRTNDRDRTDEGNGAEIGDPIRHSDDFAVPPRVETGSGTAREAEREPRDRAADGVAEQVMHWIGSRPEIYVVALLLLGLVLGRRTRRRAGGGSVESIRPGDRLVLDVREVV